jgi:hypothetical protein
MEQLRLLEGLSLFEVACPVAGTARISHVSEEWSPGVAATWGIEFSCHAYGCEAATARAASVSRNLAASRSSRRLPWEVQDEAGRMGQLPSS